MAGSSLNLKLTLVPHVATCGEVEAAVAAGDAETVALEATVPDPGALIAPVAGIPRRAASGLAAT